ncbi:hypothetical protein GLOIN_2v1839574 [Rhizophagus clarus]|uniref:Uncharacterized protein n=1 Tax=Rhizophagus clarus TaxID=94130 RepID=A0A8H3MEU4_9GLOM|nr:hypothetical protein GLOIN_2v1839574 [Rhizophagus clarus]
MSASEKYFWTKCPYQSYYGFLKYHCHIIIASITSTTTDLKDLDNLWAMHFLHEGKDFPDLHNKIRFFYFAKKG